VDPQTIVQGIKPSVMQGFPRFLFRRWSDENYRHGLWTVGSQVSLILTSHGHEVTVIDHDDNALVRLARISREGS